MPNAAAHPERSPADATPREKIAAAIEPRHTRRYRAIAFQTYVFVASGVFVALAVIAHSVAYFPIDLKVTRAIQSYHGVAFDRFLYAFSWLGFFPQVAVFALVVVLGLVVAGLRWEAISLAFACGSAALGTLVKLVVVRPRPSVDLVHVFRQLHSSSFPSGHVLTFTAFCGFLIFLTYTLLKPSGLRSTLLIVLGCVVAFMGPSRIYLGQHWFSDVMGAYLFGSLWLALTIRFYRWGKTRFFVHQPVAPAAPAGSDEGTA